MSSGSAFRTLPAAASGRGDFNLAGAGGAPGSRCGPPESSNAAFLRPFPICRTEVTTRGLGAVWERPPVDGYGP